MRELQTEYEDRVFFNVLPAEATGLQAEALLAVGFAELKHGLIAYDAQGRIATTLPGHQYGKPEVEKALLGILP